MSIVGSVISNLNVNVNVNVYLLFDCISMVGRLCTMHLGMAMSQCPSCWCG